MKAKLDFSDPDRPTLTVVLSQRNLISLLVKLEDPASLASLTSGNVFVGDESSDDWTLLVVAEDNDEHYGARTPGPMVTRTEQMVARIQDPERTYITGTGQELRGTHLPGECAGPYCVIHNPSEHPLSDAPTHWRDDRQIMERICPHGVGHPDPDQLAFFRSIMDEKNASAMMVHACCSEGCCREEDA